MPEVGKENLESTSELSLENQIPTLEVDDEANHDTMMGMEMDEEEDLGEGSSAHYGPFRGMETRTLYHQPRSDQDTLYVPYSHF